MIRTLATAALGASLILLAVPSHAAPSPAADEPPLNDSARNIREVREVALSPDGSQVAAAIAASTAEGGQLHLWLLSTDGKTARQITSSSGDKEPGERSPAWARDGSRLYFLAKRGEASRLYRLPMAGGEAEGLTLARSYKGDLVAGWAAKGDGAAVNASGFQISPDDRRIALIAADGESVLREAQKKKKDDAVRVGHDDVQKTRLYLVDAQTGAAREIALPDDAKSARWSPAGDELLVVTAPDDEDLAPGARLWRVKAADGAATQVAGVPPTVVNAAWRDGGVVYEAGSADDAPPGVNDLYALDFATGAPRNLTHGLKGSLDNSPFVVERGGKTAVLAVQVGVDQKPARVDLATGAITWLDAGQPVVGGLDTNPRETGWAMLAGGPTQPTTAWFAPKLGAAPTPLVTPQLMPPEWPATPSQRIAWTNGRLKLEGLLYLPKAAAGTKVPLVVNVHGGPTGVFQDRYSNLANLLVAQGWAVFQPNPRGSTGYGAAFSAANRNDLGGGDYTDIMTGVDAVLAKYPLDPARMALIGYSYGGEMAGFVEGRTDRFKALVAGAPVSDQFSEYGTEDSSFYDRWFYGKPWEHFADAWRQSPLAKVGRAKTPLLLLQGEDDPVDPLGQSQEMYRAMTQVGAPVVLVTYPRETHATLGAGFAARPTREPWHGTDLRRRMIRFIADAFAGKPPAKAP